ncbi:alpha-ketoglutarate-dependent dioxygenase AlkB [Pseudoxanthomonas sp. PXM02]|nr:alpha-ketoglutarate-dependent dioxygenase AlkB [Pseudoxanthomonas sp. PXM02]
MIDDLFAPAMVQLVDDAEGGIRYWPGVIDPVTARRWFDVLHAHAAWTHLQRPMYDRIVDVPRLLANYAVDALPNDLPLAHLLACVQAKAPAPYSRIGMNLYRDGNDSVAMHGDKLHTVAAGHPITLVSLGAPRRMLIRATSGARDTVAVDLAPGSVLSMSHASQTTHEHGIPKTQRSQGARISVVFRVRPASPVGTGGIAGVGAT